MTIEFKEERITSREIEIREPYVGYFTPNGKLIDYNVLLGENCHDAWRNPVSWAFLSWVCYIIKGTSIEDLKEWVYPNLVANNQYPGINEYVIRGIGNTYDFNYDNIDCFLQTLYRRIEYIEDTWHVLGKMEGWLAFEYELLLFFRNAYKDKKFFDTIQRKITIENPDTIKKILKYKYRNCNLTDRKLEDIYCDYLKRELLSYFKEICIQYLGYDALERFTPTGKLIEIPYRTHEYDFDFLANPRVITSSYPNVNERYYNYLIMGWDVHKIPRYYYNEQTGLYEKSDFNICYQSEREQKLEQEIQSIRKIKPIKERKKYFR